MRVLVCEGGFQTTRVSVALTRGGVVRVREPAAALAWSQREQPDAILLAPGCKDRWGGWIPLLRAACPSAGIVVLVDAFDEERGREKIASGALVYAEKWPLALRSLIDAACASASAAAPRRARQTTG